MSLGRPYAAVTVIAGSHASGWVRSPYRTTPRIDPVQYAPMMLSPSPTAVAAITGGTIQ